MILSALTTIQLIITTLNNITGSLYHFPQRTTVDLLEQEGYPVETHTVETADHYMLTLHRIPHGKRPVPSKGPIVLMHGIACSSADWVVIGNKSLAIVLADAGYDVWLPNSRGNTYSRRNTRLDPEQNITEFFHYSYHELGTMDLPAIIDYVLDKNKVEKLTYLGHSQGSTQILALLSERPEYNEKLSQVHCWAPVTNTYKVDFLMIKIALKFPILEKIIRFLQWYELFPHARISNIFRALCLGGNRVCRIFLHIIGSSWERMGTKDSILKILENYPAGLSLHQANHYLQGARSGVFRPYDYGSIQNMKIYNKTVPDPYKLESINVPVFFYFATSDFYVNYEILLNEVAPRLKHVKSYLVPYRNFNHADFLYSTDKDVLLYETLFNLASK